MWQSRRGPAALALARRRARHAAGDGAGAHAGPRAGERACGASGGGVRRKQVGCRRGCNWDVNFQGEDQWKSNEQLPGVGAHMT